MKEVDLQGYICKVHGIPATACASQHTEYSWCNEHNLPEVVCPFHSCPACGSGHKADMPDDNLVCSHPFHTADPSHQYGQMINREGGGADAGGEADPLVQEPND